MKSPKARFQEVGQNAETWRKLTGEIIFEEAADAAMLQFIDNLGDTASPEDSQKILGARRFLKTLSTLGDVATPEKPKPTSKLNYDTQR